MKFCFFILTVAVLAGCQRELDNPESYHSVKLVFVPVVQNSLLSEATYHNAFAEDYTVRTFRFYVGKPLMSVGGQPRNGVSDAKYYLMDKDNQAMELAFTIPTGIAESVSFQLGVDSIDNVSGAQAGALDPGNGMFWTWSSGYIMAKLEGKSSFSSMPDGSISYHVGGFAGANNVVERIRLSLPHAIELLPGASTTFTIEADIDAWFSSVHEMRIAENAFVHSPGSLAKKYAENYTQMFRLGKIETQ